MARHHAAISFWLETSGDDLTPRPPLDGSTEVDVAILGAGFTATYDGSEGVSGIWIGATVTGSTAGSIISSLALDYDTTGLFQTAPL